VSNIRDGYPGTSLRPSKHAEYLRSMRSGSSMWEPSGEYGSVRSSDYPCISSCCSGECSPDSHCTSCEGDSEFDSVPLRRKLALELLYIFIVWVGILTTIHWFLPH
jgi:hypothetical protein